MHCLLKGEAITLLTITTKASNSLTCQLVNLLTIRKNKDRE